LVAGLLVGAAVGVTMSCGGGGGSAPPSPTPSGSHRLTADEAQRLAQMRYLNYQGVGVKFDATVPTTDGTITVNGYADYREGLAIGIVSAQGHSDLVEWNGGTLAVWSGVTYTTPPATLPGKPSGNRPLESSGNPLDTTLQVILTLGNKKPDDAKALQKSNALWLRTDTIDGATVDVIAGPGANGKASLVTYWVTSDGHLVRVQVDLGGTPAPMEVNLDAADFKTFPRTNVLTGGN